jgi:hypothetical protein
MRPLLLAVAAVLGATLVACGSGATAGVAGTAIKPISTSAIPATLLGLEVHAEDVKNVVASADNTYLTAVGLFSMRRNNLVVATMQVSKLNGKFDYSDARQRTLLADKVGGARSEEHRIGGQRVYLTQGTRQQIAIWFKGRDLFVLSTREDFDQPRALLRSALGLSL